MSEVIVDDYEVVDGESVHISITVGDAQLGVSSIYLGENLIETGSDLNNVEVGDGKDLHGKLLWVKTIVSDVNDATDDTSVTYDLTGGTAPKSETREAKADSAGGTVTYRASFDLI